ncbi:hypothetical protein OG711_07960 [Streptomyces uncialis]|uniref:hypothetical protein n=1 Tax=Streptomyces uncialis TaxID=1048205 RepID=UPI002E2F14C8|nr:hypothetical protein [Streptomyces uncialis]
MPHTETLLASARGALDRMPPARHHAGWAARLDCLQHAADQIQQTLSETASGSDSEAAHDRDQAVWPLLVTWAEHTGTACDLADQHRAPAAAALSGDELREWTEMARAGVRPPRLV